MKKITFLAAIAAALTFASCGNKTNADDVASDSLSFEQAQIENSVMEQLDSIADQWNKLSPVEGVFANGKIQLSEDEQKAKPTYLLDLKTVNDMSLLSQKYRALGILAVDLQVMKLYKMNTDAQKAAIAKLAVDINDPAVKAFEGGDYKAEDIRTFYSAEREAGRINFFWETSAAALVENLYILVQNSDKFLPAFDDKAAADLSYHVALLKLSIDDLATYDTYVKEISEILAPLNDLNAISAGQLKEQIAKMKPQIEGARAALLK